MVDEKEIFVEKTQAKKKSRHQLLVKQKRKEVCNGPKKQQQPQKTTRLRRIGVVLVVNIERDVATATSQRNILVSAEERHCWSHSCHDACHTVLVC